MRINLPLEDDLEKGQDPSLAFAHTDDSHARSIVKGLTWRCVATMTTVFISWIVIGDISSALEIGFFEFFSKVFLYYLHERIWLRIGGI